VKCCSARHCFYFLLQGETEDGIRVRGSLCPLLDQAGRCEHNHDGELCCC
jgi:hypothetical protein